MAQELEEQEDSHAKQLHEHEESRARAESEHNAAAAELRGRLDEASAATAALRESGAARDAELGHSRAEVERLQAALERATAEAVEESARLDSRHELLCGSLDTMRRELLDERARQASASAEESNAAVLQATPPCLTHMRVSMP